MGTPPKGCDLTDAVPFAPPFPLVWLEHALHRRSRSDFSKRTEGLEAESAAIFSSARERMSRDMVAGEGGWKGEVRAVGVQARVSVSFTWSGIQGTAGR